MKTKSPSASQVRSPAPSSKPPKPTFNPINAPPPEQCLEAYLKAARAATSMSQLLPYLPPGERKTLEDWQKQYDPKVAAQHRAKYVQDGRLDKEAIDHLTAAPYDNSLKHNRAIANKVLAINSTKVEGDEATIQVAIAINDVHNGQVYTRSTATIGMVGEGNMWYLRTFRESNWATR